MDLWIRSQLDVDIQILIKAERVIVDDLIDDKDIGYVVRVNDLIVATYKSREQAIKVLDEIESLLIDCINIDPNNSIIYQMPLDINEEEE